MADAQIPPEVKAYQLARPNEYSSHGLKAFLIAGMAICTVSVGLRFYARRTARLGYRADDWTLLVALVRHRTSFLYLSLSLFFIALLEALRWEKLDENSWLTAMPLVYDRCS